MLLMDLACMKNKALERCLCFVEKSSKFCVPSANVGMDFTESANLTAHLRKRDGNPRQWGEVRAVVNLLNYSSW